MNSNSKFALTKKATEVAFNKFALMAAASSVSQPQHYLYANQRLTLEKGDSQKVRFISNLTRFGTKSKQDRDLLQHLEQDEESLVHDKKPVDLFLGEWGRILGESLKPKSNDEKATQSDSDIEARNGWSEQLGSDSELEDDAWVSGTHRPGQKGHTSDFEEEEFNRGEGEWGTDSENDDDDDDDDHGGQMMPIPSLF